MNRVLLIFFVLGVVFVAISSCLPGYSLPWSKGPMMPYEIWLESQDNPTVEEEYLQSLDLSLNEVLIKTFQCLVD